MPPYEIIMSSTTLQRIVLYKNELISKSKIPGYYMKTQLNSFKRNSALEEISTEQFIQLLLKTKLIVCFAECEVIGDGTDWNHTELMILGDINVAMSVEVFDNGAWSTSDKMFKMHSPPLTADLLFTPGPLLHGGVFKGKTPDFEEISDGSKIDQVKYTNLIERRLLPLLIYSSAKAKNENKKALIVLPGIGCGNFAGRYQGEMGERLNQALQDILDRNGTRLSNIACVWYGPYSECEDFESSIHNIKYRVRKTTGPLGKPQLSSVNSFEEIKNEFKDCTLFKIVAWDHVSLPGNDYFEEIRNTDDGVSAAATNSMEIITGLRGTYKNGHYLPPQGFRSWNLVAMKYQTHLVVDMNVKIAVPEGTCIELTQFESIQAKK